MRKHDPRQAIGRRRQARARVRIVDVPESEAPPDGSVTTKQAAEVTLPRSELDRIWNAEYLERLAATYWRFLTRVSLGLLRVLYTADTREIVLLGRPFVLLRFLAPEYEMAPNRGTVTWRIDKGVLVAPAGRAKGYLRISVERLEDRSGQVSGTVTCEVANFYPLVAGWGWFSRIGRHLYRITQLRIHVIVTNSFLRSLARLDLVRSSVGAFAPPREPTQERAAAG
ncbi:MAG: hypothetical protein H0U24_05835 [Thermoleophilaceae bacterium]|nr:hypothetical protein [Thermoleophilaceae bacterium]